MEKMNICIFLKVLTNIMYKEKLKEINNIKDILEYKYYERKSILEKGNCDILELELAELEKELKNNNK